jgi:hypothetical protein
MTTIKRSSKDFPDLCRALGYRKRNVYVTATTRVNINGVNWSGGSRSTYHGVDLATGAVNTANHFGVPAPWSNQYEGATVDLVPGKAIVQTGTFCGKASVMFIYVHPDNMPALLGE